MCRNLWLSVTTSDEEKSQEFIAAPHNRRTGKIFNAQVQTFVSQKCCFRIQMRRFYLDHPNEIRGVRWKRSDLSILCSIILILGHSDSTVLRYAIIERRRSNDTHANRRPWKYPSREWNGCSKTTSVESVRVCRRILHHQEPVFQGLHNRNQIILDINRPCRRYWAGGSKDAIRIDARPVDRRDDLQTTTTKHDDSDGPIQWFEARCRKNETTNKQR